MMTAARKLCLHFCVQRLQSGLYVMRPLSLRNMAHSCFLFLLILGIHLTSVSAVAVRGVFIPKTPVGTPVFETVNSRQGIYTTFCRCAVSGRVFHDFQPSSAEPEKILRVVSIFCARTPLRRLPPSKNIGLHISLILS